MSGPTDEVVEFVARVSEWSRERQSNAFFVANMIVGLYLATVWMAKWAFLGRLNAYETEKFREKVRYCFFNCRQSTICL